MQINENTIDEIHQKAKELIEQLDIINLVVPADENSEAKNNNLTELDKKLNELIYTFNKVYYNLDGDAYRLKLMGNLHYRDEVSDTIKIKSYQLFSIKKQDRENLEYSKDGIGNKIDPVKELQEIHRRVVKLCYYIDQIKLYEKFKSIEAKINETNDLDFEKDELSKFFGKRKRKRKVF